MRNIVDILKDRKVLEYPKNIFDKEMYKISISNYSCYLVVNKSISIRSLINVIKAYIGEDYKIEIGSFESKIIYGYNIVSIVSDIDNKRLSIVTQDLISEINRLGKDICIIDNIEDII